ncbi:hypothetical protein [Streptomyces sp. 7N604]|uniref:hypothetical protein n=1 Tax=Streptomyces sp. 7N604 TaxID=3457415 RepID=UPI003FD1BFEC
MAADRGGYLIDTGPLPEVSRALLRHRALDHRLGAVGDALVAGAHQVTLWWWASRQVASGRWRQREDALGGRRRPAAPVVVYPEAVRLAELMWDWEQHRATSRTTEDAWQAWLASVAEAFAVQGIVAGRESEPLVAWGHQHHRARELAVTQPRTAAERHWAQLPALHRPLGKPGAVPDHAVPAVGVRIAPDLHHRGVPVLPRAGPFVPVGARPGLP